MENKSISELEGWRWEGSIPKRETHSGVECRFYELHTKPISDLEIDEIRFLIGQNSGLEHLVPYAISKLKEDILFEAEYYPGDLLCSVLQINNKPNYWITHRNVQQDMIHLMNENIHRLSSSDVNYEIIQKIKAAYKAFQAV